MRKWGGLFLGYLLGKNYRRRDRDHLVPPRRIDAAVCRAEVCYPFGRKHGRHRAMKRRKFITLLGGAATWPLTARAQQPKVPTIGALVIGNINPEQFWREFRQGLHDLGYVEGQNIRFEFRSAEGQINRLPELAAVACTRFRRHRVRCFDGAGGGSWRDGSLRESSSLRPCA